VSESTNYKMGCKMLTAPTSKKDNSPSVMLETYLQSPPTITDKIALCDLLELGTDSRVRSHITALISSDDWKVYLNKPKKQ
jgi:hypothetical protein